MKKILTILFVCLLALKASAQMANAGADVTIYLSQTDTAQLDGSASSGSTFQWTEVSSDYSSGATISNSTSKVATVSGLPQGVWYFQIKVNGSLVDTMAVVVDYAPPPPSGTLLRHLEMENSTIYNYINDRSDTTQLSGSPSGVTTGDGDYFFDRARSKSMFIDAQHDKFYSTGEDGYHWQSNTGYSRVEGSFGSYWTFDTSKTYVIEWKGYAKDDFSILAANQTVGALFQVHSNNGDSPPFGISFLNGHDGGDTHRGTDGVKGLYFSDIWPPTSIYGYNYVNSLDSMVNMTHTYRLVMREGQDDPILEFYMDGILKYSRFSGTISNTPNEDYPKFATFYDYGNAMIDPNNLARGRKWSLVTEAYRIYEITDTTGAGGSSSSSSPTVTTSGDQSITFDSTTIFSTATAAAGHTITSYLWTKISGPGTTTIGTNTSSSTTVSNLQTGKYVFRITVTQDDGRTAYAEVTITVNSVTPPVMSAGPDQWIHSNKIVFINN